MLIGFLTNAFSGKYKKKTKESFQFEKSQKNRGKKTGDEKLQNTRAI